MANKKEEESKERLTQKYFRIRGLFEKMCRDKNLPCEDYLKRYPTEISEDLTESEIGKFVSLLNKDFRVLIKGLFLEDWKTTIAASFDTTHQNSVLDLVEATIKGDPADAYKYFSQTNDLLKLLNNEATRERALIYLEDYCATNSFESIINNYDLVFRSKHKKLADEARNRGFEKQRVFGKRRENDYLGYFNASEKRHLHEEQVQSQPCRE